MRVGCRGVCAVVLVRAPAQHVYRHPGLSLHMLVHMIACLDVHTGIRLHTNQGQKGEGLACNHLVQELGGEVHFPDAGCLPLLRNHLS